MNKLWKNLGAAAGISLAIVLSWYVGVRQDTADAHGIAANGGFAATTAAPPHVLTPEKRYLFDVSHHSPEEVLALLERAAEVHAESTPRVRRHLRYAGISGPDTSRSPAAQGSTV